MNLNEICLLKFLTNPDELSDITKFFGNADKDFAPSDDNRVFENIVKMFNDNRICG